MADKPKSLSGGLGCHGLAGRRQLRQIRGDGSLVVCRQVAEDRRHRWVGVATLAGEDELDLAQQVSIVLRREHGIKKLRAAFAVIAMAPCTITGVQGLAARHQLGWTLRDVVHDRQRLKIGRHVGKILQRQIGIEHVVLHLRVHAEATADVHQLLD